MSAEEPETEAGAANDATEVVDDDFSTRLRNVAGSQAAETQFGEAWSDEDDAADDAESESHPWSVVTDHAAALVSVGAAVAAITVVVGWMMLHKDRPAPSTAAEKNTSSLTAQPSPNAPPSSCGINLDADQVRGAMEAFEKGDPGFAPNGVVQSGGNFDPCATFSTVLVYPYGASSSAPQMALMFHKGQYVGTATPAPYAYMRLNAQQTTDTTVVLDFAESAGSCGACPDKGYESIRFRWQGDHIEMVGSPPSYGRAGP
jgi:hypothetical protein